MIQPCKLGFDCPYGDYRKGIWRCTYPYLGLQASIYDTEVVNDNHQCNLMLDNSILNGIISEYEMKLNRAKEGNGDDC